MPDTTMTWAEVAARLAPARTYWLGTTTPSGAPHVHRSGARLPAGRPARAAGGARAKPPTTRPPPGPHPPGEGGGGPERGGPPRPPPAPPPGARRGGGPCR